MSTRLSIIHGRLVRAELQLIAEVGESLAINATVFVSRDWQGPNFIGYGGFLERVRFAIDPGQDQNHFHFGPTS